MTNKMVDGVVVPLTEAEEQELADRNAAWEAGAFDRAIGRLRQDRNQRLAASDWSVLSDVALTVEKDTEWKDYRQALRNLPAGMTTVADVEGASWPTAPS